jgi:hypothetical protein
VKEERKERKGNKPIEIGMHTPHHHHLALNPEDVCY